MDEFLLMCSVYLHLSWIDWRANLSIYVCVKRISNSSSNTIINRKKFANISFLIPLFFFIYFKQRVPTALLLIPFDSFSFQVPVYLCGGRNEWTKMGKRNSWAVSFHPPFIEIINQLSVWKCSPFIHKQKSIHRLGQMIIAYSRQLRIIWNRLSCLCFLSFLLFVCFFSPFI